MAFRDYSIDISKQVNRLVPWYLRGRRMLLFLQGISYPLNFFNDSETGFNGWAHRKLYELSMTAQKLRLEWHINNVIVPENNIELVEGGRVTISPSSYSSTILFFRDEITDQATAPLFYPNLIPTVTRLKTDEGDRSRQVTNTRLFDEHGGTSGRFLINVPYAGDDMEGVSRIITAGISRYVPVGVIFSINYTI